MLSRGGVHSAIPDVAAALADYHKAFKIYRAIDDRCAEAVALLQIASLYIQASDNDTALRYYDQEIGRDNVCTTVTNVHLVCRLLLEITNNNSNNTNTPYQITTPHGTNQTT